MIPARGSFGVDNRQLSGENLKNFRIFDRKKLNHSGGWACASQPASQLAASSLLLEGLSGWLAGGSAQDFRLSGCSHPVARRLVWEEVSGGELEPPTLPATGDGSCRLAADADRLLGGGDEKVKQVAS